MSDPQTKVSVFQNGELIREHVLPPGEYVIDQQGDAQNSVFGEVIDGPHARLHLTGGSRSVGDSGSIAATVVDGETVMTSAVSAFRQEIRLGDLEIVLGCTSEDSRPGVTVRRPLHEEIRNPIRYQIGKMVARGGMGVIMSARDVVVQREVAMKLMIDGTKPESVARFFQEAQITAQLEHPNIVPVHELSLNEQDQPFYTMKLVRGISLKKVLERLSGGDPLTVRQWPLSALLIVFQKVCDAIAFAHARGVIHRDLKPDNIMLGEYGEAQVMDWGLAKVLGPGSVTRAHLPVPPPDDAEPTAPADQTTVGPTMSGTVIGTPQYMPPEQANGVVELMDERTDIYSLGAILYHILTLRPPFLGRTSSEVLQNVRLGNIVPLAEACAEKRLAHLPSGRLPESLAAVALQAMALEKAQRYPAVKILQNDIEAYQTGFATSAEHAGLWKLGGLFLRRHRTVSLAVALLLLAGVVFAFNLARERDRAEAASVLAQAARRTADEQRDAAENQLYLSEMLQAGRHLADGRPESARTLLLRHHVEPSGRDLRGWEWFYLSGEANQDRLRVHAHPGGVFALAASADGTRLATGGGDGDIAVWQTRGLVPEFRLRGSAAPVLTVAWHAGGKLLAGGCADGLVRVWEVETQKSVAEFRLSSGAAVRSIGWRPADGGTPTLILGSMEKEILLWRPLEPGKAGEPETFATTTRGGVAALHWSADGRRLAAGELDADQPVEVFDFASRTRVLSTNTTSGNDAYTIAIDPSGQYVAAGSKHLRVVVWELNTKKMVSVEALHRGFVSALVWSPDGKRLASASHDGTIRLSSPLQGKSPVQVLSGHQGEVNALAWTRLPALSGAAMTPTALFSGGADGTLRAWTPDTDGAFTVPGGNWIAAAGWNPTGTRLAVANFRNLIHLGDPASGLSFPIIPIVGNIFDVAWAPGGDRLATASRGNHRVEMLDAATGRSCGIFGLPSAYRVAWSPSGRFLAACGSEGARVWDTKTGALMVVISRPAGSILWHPDERRIILGGDNGAIELWDVTTGKIVATWRPPPQALTGSVASETEPPRQVFDLRWSPDMRLLAFATQDSVAGVFDAREGRLVRTFSGHTSGIWRVVWNSDGRRLATVGQDGMLRVYDAAIGGQVAHINHGLGNTELHALDWSRDGRRLVSGGFDRYVRVWDAQRGERLVAVEQLAQRAQARPNDLETLRELARTFTQLGRADDARHAFARARAIAPDDAALISAAAEAEQSLAHTFETAFADSAPAPAPDARAITLLSAMHHASEEGKTETALGIWRDLARLPAAAEWLPLARTYLSRANWSATWFPSKVDPDLPGWRAQEASSEAVAVNLRTLCFPYLQRGPKDLLLASELNERGPGARNFGMIARARLKLPAGSWRFRAVGGGGVRVLLNDKAIIDQWTADAPAEKTADYDQATTGPVELTVEHFVLNGADDFQFLIEPVSD
jgi:WD40 repeat protein/serine/threonine protein kinase